jgi:hypothetical protein
MYSMRGEGGGGWGAKRDRQCYYSYRLDSFAAKAIEGFHWFPELFLIITHRFKGG